MKTRKCKVCQIEKPINEFYKPTIRTCKKCTCEINSQKIINKNLRENKNIDGEIWMNVVGYGELYKISNKGRIRTFVKHSYRRGKIMKPFRHKQGYLRISLVKNGKSKSYMMHRLVAEAFIYNPDNKLEINHKNGIKHDNRVENLEWCTSLENIKHSITTGLTRRKSKSEIFSIVQKTNKLNKNQILSIISDYKKGKKQCQIAANYNVSRAQICRIVNGKSRKFTLDYLKENNLQNHHYLILK
jgi:hypothetical protein